MTDSKSCIGVVLAGGSARRMGGESKALMPLGGQRMIDHVIDRLEPQVDEIWLSISASSPPLADLNFRQLADPEPGHCGPLAGLVQGLVDLPDKSLLLLVPCDAPFLPVDLLERLITAIGEEHLAAVASEGEQLHPTFSIWRKDALAQVAKALAGNKGLWQALESLPHAVAQWPPEVPTPFFNVNEPGDLQRAALWLDREQPKIGP